MSTIEGTVVYSKASSTKHATESRILHSELLLHVRQAGRGSPIVRVRVNTGAGNDGMRRADIMSARLRPGVVCQAHGTHLTAEPDPADHKATVLVLHACTHVRGGEQQPYHERTSSQTDAEAA